MSLPAAETSLPPLALDAERAVLGSMLIDPKAAEIARVRLEPIDFYPESHRAVFQTAVDLMQQGVGVDLLLVRQRLKQAGKVLDEKLEHPDGFLAGLVSKVGTSAHIEYYARFVKEASLDRQINQAIYTTYKSRTAEAMAHLQDLMLKRRGLGAPPVFDFRTDLHDAVDEILTKPARGLDTGFPTVDAILNGLEPGDLFTIAARTNKGKTIILTQIAVNIAKRGRPALYFSTEMKASQLVGRILPAMTGVQAWRFKRRNFGQEHVSAITDAAEELSGYPLMVCSAPYPSLEDIKATVIQTRPEIAFIDYVQRCNHGKAESRTIGIANFMRDLKTFARETDVRFVLAAQADRGLDKETTRPPVLSDISDSSAIEKESDVVGMVWQPPADKVAPPLTNDKFVPLEMIFRKGRSSEADVAAQFELDRSIVKLAERVDAL